MRACELHLYRYRFAPSRDALIIPNGAISFPMQLSLFKACSKCGQSKAVTQFKWRGNRFDSWCKQCYRDNSNQFNKDNADLHRHQSNQYYLNHRGERMDYQRQYTKEHPDQHARWARSWRKRNPEALRVAQHRRRAIKSQSQGTFTIEQFREMCARYGNVCLKCKQPKTLTPDHVIPLSKGGSNSIENIQPLCRSCNQSKGTKSIDYR